MSLQPFMPSKEQREEYRELRRQRRREEAKEQTRYWTSCSACGKWVEVPSEEATVCDPCSKGAIPAARVEALKKRFSGYGE